MLLLMQNVLNLDPTRTTMLRKRFMADMSRRFILLLREILKLIIEDDAFGLKLPKGFTFNEAGVCLFGEQLHDDQLLLLNAKQQWRFRTDDQKVAAFRAWLQEQVDEKILTVEGEGDPWLATYIHSGYRQGAIRAWLDVRPDKLTEPAGFAAGSKAQFLSESFAQPEALSKLKLLSTRSFEELKGVTTQMGANMNRVLSDGIAHGKNPRAIARDLSKQVGVSRKRALVIARTEIIHAHSEGQLDSFERLGVDELGVMVEWSTAGDARVCKACQSMSGKTFTVKEARGLIPKHPNCRCAFIPSLSPVKKTRKKKVKMSEEVKQAAKIRAASENPRLDEGVRHLHGTTVERAKSILKNGLNPRLDLQLHAYPGVGAAELDKKVFTTDNFDIAAYYGRTHAITSRESELGERFAIVEIRVPADKATSATRLPDGAFAFDKIPPEWIKAIHIKDPAGGFIREEIR